ncbi:uncharacterized protein LOC117299334 isoform X1 [Asterias rubens]|uniref:uncharacterized protein LOC117299334 isoform X1 n=1 Tax=Asterias rubens TaxID=7604 RepID=UPI001455BD9B|nr:uncharacterized protein LOC117299334 isoform X1 [Asterias rubens]
MASNALGRRFTMDFNYLDMVWPTGTKITVRAGDCQPVTVLNSQSRLLAHEKRDKIGGLNPVDSVILTADRGYLLWTNPRGSIEVKFKYGRSGEDFNCFIDPQHQGIMIYEMRGNYQKELVVDGRQPISKNTNPHHLKSMGVRRGENNFEFRSKKSEVRLVLETVRDMPALQAFKFNYVLTL